MIETWKGKLRNVINSEADSKQSEITGKYLFLKRYKIDFVI
jgi:hypothetical protein